MNIKEILHGSEARLKLAQGIDKAANVITSTLGPKGRNVVLEQVHGYPRLTKDGVSVAKEIHFSDPFENMGAELLANISNKTCEDAGDGTTTASLLAQHIFLEGIKAIQVGINPVDLKEGLEKAVDCVVSHIKEHATPITGEEQLKQIATISANGDAHIGDLLAKAFSQIGEDGIITLMNGKTAQTTLEFQNGIHMEGGFDQSATTCITSPSTETCEYRDCALFFHEASFPNEEKTKALINVVNRQADREPTPLLVMADSFNSEIAIPIINANNARNLTRICPVNLPMLQQDNERARQYRRDFLTDFAILTGGKLIEREEGKVFSKHISSEYFGYAETIVVSRHKTVIIGGKGDQEAIEAQKVRLQEEQKLLREELNFDSEYDEHLSNRLRNFNGIAIIRGGGTTAVEISERKDRIEDAMHATRASLAEGIVPGGGIALLKSIASLDKQGLSEGVLAGMNIIEKALSAPLRKIIQNAGKNDALILSQLEAAPAYTTGYDAKNDRIVDMIEHGIIDPAKVPRSCLQNAVSIIGLLLTSEHLVTYKEREVNPMAKFKMS